MGLHRFHLAGIVTSPRGVVLAPSASFVPAAAGAEHPATRRYVQTFGAGESGTSTGTQDICSRATFLVPWTATRMRFRVANQNAYANTTNATPVLIKGIAVGAADLTAAVWNRKFASTPVVADPGNTTASSLATEYVGPWYAIPASLRGQLAAYSIGATCATDSEMNGSYSPGATAFGATGAGNAAAFANVTMPTGTGIIACYQMLDVRIEMEYVGSDPITLFLGTSLTGGFRSDFGIFATPRGNLGSLDRYPELAGAKNGQHAINGGITQAVVTNYNSTSNVAWERLLAAADDQARGYTWPGNVVPDLCVIDFGANELTTGIALSTFQSNYLTLAAQVRSLGIGRLMSTTVPPGYMYNAAFPSNPTYSVGILKTATAVGSLASVTLLGPTAAGSGSSAGQAGPGGGWPGNLGNWYQASGGPWQIWMDYPASNVQDGPFTVSGASGTASLALTLSGATAAYAHPVGTVVMSTAEGLRQAYNFWLRSGVPGFIGNIDLARVAEHGTGGFMAATTSDDPVTPGPMHQSPLFYPYAANIHPTIGLYQAWAPIVAMALLGI